MSGRPTAGEGRSGPRPPICYQSGTTPTPASTTPRGRWVVVEVAAVAAVEAAGGMVVETAGAAAGAAAGVAVGEGVGSHPMARTAGGGIYLRPRREWNGNGGGVQTTAVAVPPTMAETGVPVVEVGVPQQRRRRPLMAASKSGRRLTSPRHVQQQQLLRGGRRRREGAAGGGTQPMGL